jgi:hypothetical protein
MVTLEQFLNLIEFRINEGSDYGWRCYGSDAYMLDSYVEEHYSASILFDRKTQVVYQVEVYDYVKNRAYRLFNPEFKSAHDAESAERNVNKQVAWDEVNFVNLETDEDFLSKLKAIVAGEEYDTRVVVPIDLPKEELFTLMKSAHERDITLNQLILEILEQEINKR